MLFNSYIFIFVFLPIAVLGYFCLNKYTNNRYAKVFLIGMSLWFYAYFNVNYLMIIVCSVFINYYFGKLLQRDSKPKTKKIYLVFTLAVNLGLLFYFKYSDMFIRYINMLFCTDYNLLHLILPLGISFFTFQQVSYLVDCYKGKVANYSFIDFALFVVFFPQLIAGPIVLHSEIIPQFTDSTRFSFNHGNFNKGLYGFSIGLAKKVIIADTVGQVVNGGYASINSLGTIAAIIVLFCYAIQVYVDFSAYSDMAIGIGRMFNIDIPLNFNSPYKARDIQEFWERNHMTLTRFFRTYVYFPLGGNRKGSVRTYLNQIIVFTLSGFWHGASLNFVIWGFIHGVANCFVRKFKSAFGRIPHFLSMCLNFAFCMLTLVFFRAPYLQDALAMLGRVFSIHSSVDSINLLSKLVFPEIIFASKWFGIYQYIFSNYTLVLIFALIVCAILASIMFFSKNTNELVNDFKPTNKYLIITVILLILSISSLSGVSTFLYYNF